MNHSSDLYWIQLFVVWSGSKMAAIEKAQLFGASLDRVFCMSLSFRPTGGNRLPVTERSLVFVTKLPGRAGGVAKATNRSAELLADFENQMGSEFAFDDDAVWAQAYNEAAIEIKKSADGHRQAMPRTWHPRSLCAQSPNAVATLRLR
jgi:hypothetical protein